MTKSKRKYKIYKNKFAKLIKEYNQAIINDDLWCGRFEMRIIRSRWEWFEDDSGGILHCIIRCFDKKTEQYKDFFTEYAPWIRSIHWRIGMDILNTFIVEDIDVWKNENPRTDEKQNWSKVKIPEHILKFNSDEAITYGYCRLVKYGEVPR